MTSVPSHVKKQLREKQEMHNSNLDLHLKNSSWDQPDKEKRKDNLETRSNVSRARSNISRARSCASKISSPAVVAWMRQRDESPEINIDRETLDLVNRYFQDEKVLSPEKSIQTMRERNPLDDTQYILKKTRKYLGM